MNGSNTAAIAGLDYPILIGDIGGTNARFAILQDSLSEPVNFPVTDTAGFASVEQTIQKIVLDQTSLQPESAILAVAGMVSGEEIHLTNRGWTFRPTDMLDSLRLSGIIVLNDFEAQALAVSVLGSNDMEQVGGGVAEDGAACAVLGPGTGLGVAGLVPFNGTWIPLAGEGGHIDIGPRNDREVEVFNHLIKIEGRASAEEVLSGRGLVNLYSAVCAARSDRPEFTAPSDISASGLASDDPAAVEALDLFVTLLGRVAGDMALIFNANGGVYLTGGIARKILPALQSGAFRQAFDDKAPHSDYMANIPVQVVTHPLAALAGIAALAQTPERFGINVSGRCWRA